MYISKTKNIFFMLAVLLMFNFIKLNASSKTIKFYLFSASDCNKCYNIKHILFPKLEKKYNMVFDYKEYDILIRKNFEFLLKIKNKLKEESAEVPVLIINDKYIAGYDSIIHKFPKIIQNLKKNNKNTYFFKINAAGNVGDLKLIPFFTVVFAGLIDGINPCVFATIIFLISYLTYLNRSKKSILTVGIFFTITVFISYVLIGFGFFKIIISADWFHSVAKSINILLGIILVVLAVFSFKDFWLALKGKTGEMNLQLSKKLKLVLHKIIRINVKQKILIFSSFIIGIIVSLVELSCTGQIYLPTIIYISRMGNLIGYFFIFIYNLMFILPLIVIFFIFYNGVESKVIREFFKKHIAIIKLFLALLFLALSLDMFWI